MPVYIVCDNDAAGVNYQTFSNGVLCVNDGQPAYRVVSIDELREEIGATQTDTAPASTDGSLGQLLFTRQLSNEDTALLAGAILLFFATCWGVNILGRSILPRG